MASIDMNWLSNYVGKIAPQIAPAGAITLNLETGVVIVNDLDEGGYKQAINTLSVLQNKNRAVTTMVDRFIGQIILHYVATRNTTVEEAIDQLDLIQLTGKQMSTILKLPRMVAALPSEAYMLPDLTTMHYETVTSYGGPKDDVEQIRSFNEDRMSLLRKISEDPSEWTRNKIGSAMREIQEKYVVKPRGGEPLSELNRKFMVMSSALIDMDDEEIQEQIGCSRAELLSRWTDLREQLIERKKLPENVTRADIFIIDHNDAPNAITETIPGTAEPTATVIAEATVLEAQEVDATEYEQ